MTGQRACFEVWGDPVSHSRSPAMHNAALEALGSSHRYAARRVPAGALLEQLAELRTSSALGVNLTVPHKRAAVPAMDSLTPVAERIGAVNTVRVVDGKLVGHNTDGQGFCAAVAELGVAGIEQAVVLGGGGASWALIDALIHELGAARLTWVSRRPHQIRHPLASHGRVERRDYFWLKRDAPERRFDLLVNATTVGMTGGPREFPEEFDFRFMKLGGGVVDIVYPATKGGLVRRAEGAKLLAQDGLPMLLWQGARALEYWLDRSLEPDIIELMRQAIFAGSSRESPKS